MKAVVAAFNQEKALVGAFSVITNLLMELIEALLDTEDHLLWCSGTLNPALQDENGQPKRDITTIVHILNDLLCAQYKAYGGSSGGSRSSKHGHHRESKSAQNSDAKTALFGESVDFSKNI